MKMQLNTNTTTPKIIAALACALMSNSSHLARAQKASAKAPAQAPTRTRAKSSALSARTVYNTRVVPGVSIGLISLGEPQAAVRRKLGVPVTSFKLNNGLSSDLWRSAAAKRWDGQLHTFEVVYRRGVAIQIEATNPAFKTSRGLGLKSSDANWNSAYGKRDESKQYSYVGGKRDQGYDDWIGAGFALEFQFLPTDGAGDPPVQMHTLIVHYKGVPVTPDPGGSSG